MPCQLQPPGGSSPGVCVWLCFSRTHRDLDQKTKQKPPKQQKICPLLAMLRYVFSGLLILQMPLRAGGHQLLLFPEFCVVASLLRGWRPRLENRTSKS